MFETEQYLSSVRGTGDFRFRLRPKMKDAFSVFFYIKLFQIIPYVSGFQILNNPGSESL